MLDRAEFYMQMLLPPDTPRYFTTNLTRKEITMRYIHFPKKHLIYLNRRMTVITLKERLYTMTDERRVICDILKLEDNPESNDFHELIHGTCDDFVEQRL